VIVMVWVTAGAAKYVESPGWVALMTQLPAEIKVIVEPEALHALDVVEKVTVKPELAVADNETVELLSAALAGAVKLMVCAVFGTVIPEEVTTTGAPTEFVEATLATDSG
jgi:hypothetical protein